MEYGVWHYGAERQTLRHDEKRLEAFEIHSLRRECLLTDAMEGIVCGKRLKGRRRYKLIDDIKGNRKYMNLKRLAEDRRAWRDTTALVECGHAFLYVRHLLKMGGGSYPSGLPGPPMPQVLLSFHIRQSVIVVVTLVSILGLKALAMWPQHVLTHSDTCSHCVLQANSSRKDAADKTVMASDSCTFRQTTNKFKHHNYIVNYFPYPQLRARHGKILVDNIDDKTSLNTCFVQRQDHKCCDKQKLLTVNEKICSNVNTKTPISSEAAMMIYKELTAFLLPAQCCQPLTCCTRGSAANCKSTVMARREVQIKNTFSIHEIKSLIQQNHKSYDVGFCKDEIPGGWLYYWLGNWDLGQGQVPPKNHEAETLTTADPSFSTPALTRQDACPPRSTRRQPTSFTYISPDAAGLGQPVLSYLSCHLEHCSVLRHTEIFQVLRMATKTKAVYCYLQNAKYAQQSSSDPLASLQVSINGDPPKSKFVGFRKLAHLRPAVRPCVNTYIKGIGGPHSTTALISPLSVGYQWRLLLSLCSKPILDIHCKVVSSSRCTPYLVKRWLCLTSPEYHPVVRGLVNKTETGYSWSNPHFWSSESVAWNGHFRSTLAVVGLFPCTDGLFWHHKEIIHLGVRKLSYVLGGITHRSQLGMPEANHKIHFGMMSLVYIDVCHLYQLEDSTTSPPSPTLRVNKPSAASGHAQAPPKIRKGREMVRGCYPYSGLAPETRAPAKASAPSEAPRLVLPAATGQYYSRVTRVRAAQLTVLSGQIALCHFKLRHTTRREEQKITHLASRQQVGLTSQTASRQVERDCAALLRQRDTLGSRMPPSGAQHQRGGTVDFVSYDPVPSLPPGLTMPDSSNCTKLALVLKTTWFYSNITLRTSISVICANGNLLSISNTGMVTTCTYFQQQQKVSLKCDTNCKSNLECPMRTRSAKCTQRSYRSGSEFTTVDGGGCLLAKGNFLSVKEIKKERERQASPSRQLFSVTVSLNKTTPYPFQLNPAGVHWTNSLFLMLASLAICLEEVSSKLKDTETGSVGVQLFNDAVQCLATFCARYIQQTVAMFTAAAMLVMTCNDKKELCHIFEIQNLRCNVANNTRKFFT
ncbi:hypothetical protein PR048_012427 [Dryococelus australis]|uniref:Uncharacterized protein n=1 Tax=Dryococelus australis TaxID=614101 RepID=A0ABQ9HPD2_9NEOP|nr:hypothetical protein PR048_012427 [Dryococelus australis]